jgi:hypothetical protein
MPAKFLTPEEVGNSALARFFLPPGRKPEHCRHSFPEKPPETSLPATQIALKAPSGFFIATHLDVDPFFTHLFRPGLPWQLSKTTQEGGSNA